VKAERRGEPHREIAERRLLVPDSLPIELSRYKRSNGKPLRIRISINSDVNCISLQFHVSLISTRVIRDRYAYVGPEIAEFPHPSAQTSARQFRKRAITSALKTVKLMKKCREEAETRRDATENLPWIYRLVGIDPRIELQWKLLLLEKLLLFPRTFHKHTLRSSQWDRFARQHRF